MRLHRPALRRALLGSLLAGCAGTALALGGQNMVLGRMVQPRADAPSVAATTQVRAAYVLHCAGCHGRDGAGAPAQYVPDLRHAGHWLKLPGGREYLIRVPGIMGSGLDDAQVAAVTNYLLRTLAAPSLPEPFQPYSAQEVTQARAAPLLDVAAERQRLLRQAQALGLPLQ